jgi:hypothetical protein
MRRYHIIYIEYDMLTFEGGNGTWVQVHARVFMYVCTCLCSHACVRGEGVIDVYIYTHTHIRTTLSSINVKMRKNMAGVFFISSVTNSQSQCSAKCLLHKFTTEHCSS